MLQEKIKTFGVYLILVAARLVVALRYRLTVKGWENLSPEHLKRVSGTLFLPNHPAEIDPVLLELVLWRKFRPRPLVVEHFYRLRGIRFFMGLVRAMPLPSMDELANKWRGKKVNEQFNNVVSALKNKENFLIYPSGRLKIAGMEMIGGASFVHNLVQACPEANIVLVRTTGLWGSKFSKALTGASPDFGKTLWECCKILIKNGLFFAPRRQVQIELDLPPADFPEKGSRLEFNKALENWYNRYPNVGSEPINLVSYAFWKEEFPTVFVATGEGQPMEERPVSKKILDEVFAHLTKLSGKPLSQIERKMHLSQDLGLDSLDVAQLYVFLDERYGVTELMPGDLHTVEDLLQFAAGYKKETGEGASLGEKRGFIWPKEKRLVPHIPEAETIQEAFLRSVERNGPSALACVDAISGPLTYRKLKVAALVLADKFRELPGDRIGILLPSSSSTYLIILAVLLAGKVPVMLNWTSGVKALDHAVDLTGITTVITASRFLDRLENGDLGEIEQMFCFIEEIRETVSLKNRCAALFLSFRSTEALLKTLKLSAISSSDPAVILFTSGTESLPKGVPLSHSNLLTNQRACLEAVPTSADEILYGVLPPFHSFGFSITGLVSLLAGMRICYAPNPNDAHGIVRDIAQYKPTLFCCAPSFIKAAFHIAKPEQLQSLRLIVAGAEKTPQDLFDYVKEHLPKARLLEGYGITECGPVVTLDRTTEPHTGVGRPIPGVELMILDLATHQPVPNGQEGEICIAGPNVFAGYLGRPREAFVTIDGRRWYASGDRGSLGPQGHLILSGRLKRFVKIGGEMVSLGGLEEEVLRIALEKHWITGREEGPTMAVSVREKDTPKPVIILFTTFSITKEDVNAALKDSGFGRIVKIAEVRTVEQIPLTGAGKTHYRLLDETVT